MFVFINTIQCFVLTGRVEIFKWFKWMVIYLCDQFHNEMSGHTPLRAN